MLGLPGSTRGRPRLPKAVGSVAGMRASDFPQLLEEWHPMANQTRTPETTEAGGGAMVDWQCRNDPSTSGRPRSAAESSAATAAATAPGGRRPGERLSARCAAERPAVREESTRRESA